MLPEHEDSEEDDDVKVRVVPLPNIEDEEEGLLPRELEEAFDEGIPAPELEHLFAGEPADDVDDGETDVEVVPEAHVADGLGSKKPQFVSRKHYSDPDRKRWNGQKCINEN